MTVFNAMTQLLLLCCLLAKVLSASYDLEAITLNAACDRSTADTIKDLALAYKLTNPSLGFTVTTSTTPKIIASMTASQLDFGTVIQGWSASQSASAPNMRMQPLLLTGFVPAYRLDALGASAPSIIFTREILVGMFTGAITKWNSVEFQEANPFLTMPNQNITMAFDVAGGARNWVVKNALYQFDFVAMNKSGMKISNDVDYPFNKYANYLTVDTGSNALVSKIIASDGSFTMSFLSTAYSLEVNIGRMRNKAGNVVSAMGDTLTFAALELGTKEPPNHSTAHVITDPEADQGWPLAYFSYVLLDTELSSGSCRARQYLTEFLLWTYTSVVAAAVAETRVFYPVPSLILSQAGAIEMLQNDVKCRGAVALPTQITEIRDISVPTSFEFISRLFTSIYRNTVAAEFRASGVAESVMLSQIINSEIDIALITQENLDSTRWNALLASDDFLILPLYGRAVTYFFNPELPSKVTLPATSRLLLDNSLMSMLLNGCVDNWNDTRLLAMNPWISSITGNASNPMSKVVGCGGATTLAPIAASMSAWVNSQKSLVNDDAKACKANAALGPAFVTCTDLPSLRVMFTRSENIAPSLALGTKGGMGYSYDTGDASMIRPYYVRNIDGNVHTATSAPAGILECAADTFDPQTLSFSLSKSQSPECWPMVQQIVAVVRKKYFSTATNTSSCVRGLDALRYLQYLIMSDASKVIIDSLNVAQLFDVPGVKEHYISALNSVVCDDETLLITLPIVWSLSEALFAASLAAAIIGFVVTNALAIYVIVQHRHPIIRSASPLFLLISLFGVQLLFGSVIALVSDVSAMSCSAFSWLVNLGLMVTFVPLFARVWRIYRIFGRKKLSVVRLSNRKLMFLVGVFWMIELAFMAAWQGAGQLQPVLTVKWEGTPSREHYYTQCSTQGGAGDAFFGIAAAEKGALLFFGALMAFSTRKVQSKFNESPQIALALYNIIFTIGIITPIMLVIGAVGDVMTALLMFMIVWIAFFTACILVVPKALHIQAQGRDGADNQSIVGSSGDSSSGFSFLSLDMLSTLAMVGAYLSALRRHVDAVEQKQICLKRQNSGGSALCSPPPRDARVLREDIRGSPVQKSVTNSFDHRLTTQRKLSQQTSTSGMPRSSVS